MRALRTCAAIAALVGALGTVAIWIAVARGPGLLAPGFVSEAGVAGLRWRALYQVGTMAVAIALALLAVAVGPLLRTAAGALAVASPMVLVSGTVSCSPGCPVPPHQRVGLTDLTHATASSSAFLLAAFAMYLLGRRVTHPRVRRVSAVATRLVVPVILLAGAAVLFIGRGFVTGTLERVGLAGSLGWLVIVAGVLAAAGPITENEPEPPPDPA